MNEKYRVHELGKFRYSDIGEYIDEDHTDRPLRNDILADLLNNQDKTIKELSEENEQLKKDLKKKFVPFAKADGGYTTVSTEEFIKILNENEQLKKEKEEIKSKAEKFVELYEVDFGKTYSTPPRSGKTVRIQLWIVRKILDEIGILELYGDIE